MNPTWIDLPSSLAPFLTLWEGEETRPGLLLLVAGAVFLLITRSVGSRSTAPAGRRDANVVPLPRQGKPSILSRLTHRPEKPLRVGSVTVDRAWRHIGVVATTGARKSTLLALMAEQLGTPVIIITGDHAPPLENFTRSVGGWVWTARGGVGWYPWGGPLELAVQRAEYMQPKTGDDVGVGRAMFKQAARAAWAAADERGSPRTLAQLREALPTVVRGQVSAGVAENWTARLLELEQSLGTSLGTQLDVVEAIRGGISVMVSLNSFQDVSNRTRFASIAVLEALRAADSVGNIGVIIDEVGLVGGELFADAVRTFRVRKVTGMFASQIVKDFPETVRGNVNVWFLGQMSGGDRESRRWASDTTFGRVAPEAFGEHALPHGKFYVVHGGRVETVKVPTWQNRWTFPPRELPGAVEDTVSTERTVTLLSNPTSNTLDTVTQPSVDEDKPEVREGPVAMPRWWQGEPWMNPADVAQLKTVWRRTIFPGGVDGCHESTYRVNNRGRPMGNWRGEQWLPYALSLVMADIRGMDREEAEKHIRVVRMSMAAGRLTVEHRCRNIKCTSAEHTYWLSREDNVGTEWEARRAVAVG